MSEQKVVHEFTAHDEGGQELPIRMVEIDNWGFEFEILQDGRWVQVHETPVIGFVHDEILRLAIDSDDRGTVIDSLVRDRDELRGLLEEVEQCNGLVMFDPNELDYDAAFPMVMKRTLWTRIRQALAKGGDDGK